MQSSLSAEEDICLYLSNISPYDCENHKCSVDDISSYRDVFYVCPGPEEFPMGQGYFLKVSKKSGNIEVTGLTN